MSVEFRGEERGGERNVRGGGEEGKGQKSFLSLSLSTATPHEHFFFFLFSLFVLSLKQSSAKELMTTHPAQETAMARAAGIAAKSDERKKRGETTEKREKKFFFFFSLFFS